MTFRLSCVALLLLLSAPLAPAQSLKDIMKNHVPPAERVV